MSALKLPDDQWNKIFREPSHKGLFIHIQAMIFLQMYQVSTTVYLPPHTLNR